MPSTEETCLNNMNPNDGPATAGSEIPVPPGAEIPPDLMTALQQLPPPVTHTQYELWRNSGTLEL